MNAQNCQWYALHIRSRFEKVAALHLKRKGYEEYLPLYRTRRFWSDRIKTVEMPLFPGYAFCKFDLDEKLPILVIPGVLSIVGSGRTPAAIPESEISSFQRLTASEAPCAPWPFVQLGQVISVARGPLAGLRGIVIEVKSQFRLVLSLPLLQRSVAVEIDRDCLDLGYAELNREVLPRATASAGSRRR